jgi:hypothetical protein
MAEAVRKDKRRKSIVSNARAIQGALEECLRLSDQMHDVRLKGETMLFVNEMDHLAASLLPHRGRVGATRPAERELVGKLWEEFMHIRQLVDAMGEIANELNDARTREILYAATARLNRFAKTISATTIND